MLTHYQNYYWKQAKPYGLIAVNPLESSYSYKIVIDPYYKRFSIEKYQAGHFVGIIYDSLLFDFRRLKAVDQTAWQKEVLSEESNTLTCLLRDHEDRAILIETHHLDPPFCRSCTLQSIHGVLLSTHYMYYQKLGDPFNGVVLYDAEDRPIMMKTYQMDPQTDEFTTLLTEEWNMEHLPNLLKTIKPVK